MRAALHHWLDESQSVSAIVFRFGIVFLILTSAGAALLEFLQH